jgi:hypothetical protein
VRAGRFVHLLRAFAARDECARSAVLSERGIFGVDTDAMNRRAQLPTVQPEHATLSGPNGPLLSTLSEVIDFYDGGGVPNAQMDRDLRPLRLSESEKRALVALLEARTSQDP